MHIKTIRRLFHQLSDESDPRGQDAAWWMLKFNWRHEALEKEERERERERNKP